MKLKDKELFLVEDDVTNMVVMMTVLERQGAKIQVDRWGDRTVNSIRRMKNVDLILMDLHLPRGLTGYDVFEQLQAQDDLKQIPVVVVSASDATLEMRKARDMGFAGYISKPINYRTFPGLIARIIDGETIWGDDFVDQVNLR